MRRIPEWRKNLQRPGRWRGQLARLLRKLADTAMGWAQVLW